MACVNRSLRSPPITQCKDRSRIRHIVLSTPTPQLILPHAHSIHPFPSHQISYLLPHRSISTHPLTNCWIHNVLSFFSFITLILESTSAWKGTRKTRAFFELIISVWVFNWPTHTQIVRYHETRNYWRKIRFSNSILRLSHSASEKKRNGNRQLRLQVILLRVFTVGLHLRGWGDRIDLWKVAIHEKVFSGINLNY